MADKSGSSSPSSRRPVAVALKHERGELPVVVAKGRGAVAEQILEVAFAAGIKVREDSDLAEFLNAVETGCPIPISCFETVAEILSYLYRANGEIKAEVGLSSPIAAR